MRHWIWPILTVVGMVGTTYFGWVHVRMLSDVPEPFKDQAHRDHETMIMDALLGTSLLILTVPANLLLRHWQRQVKASETGITSDTRKQASCGLASIIVLRGVLLCLSAIALVFLGLSITPPRRAGEFGALNLLPLVMAFWGLAMPAWGIGVVGFFLAMVGLLQKQRRRSMAVAGLLLNGIIVLPVIYLFGALYVLSGGSNHFW